MHTSLLIIGAGPFGLAMAVQARAIGVDHLVIGQPMSFWKDQMPAGMVLRSGCDWHLDPLERDTIEHFLETRGQTPADVEPLSLGFYLEYAEWFQRVKGIQVERSRVVRLNHLDNRFAARLNDGSRVTADRVLLALGFAPFAHIPGELASLVPATKSSHTCDFNNPDRFRGQRVLVVGGRQSAFESAALLAEAGASGVHVCFRHDTPAFIDSDWTWVTPLLERMGNEPGWYRSLSDDERKKLNARFWAEGRLKLEPWLGPRVRHKVISIHPRTRIVGAESSELAVRARLDSGDSLEVDHVLYATGYQVDMRNVLMLQAGNLLDRIRCRDGCPQLDDFLQTTVPGLFVTSLAAARDFGLFFAFTAAVRASARLVAAAL